MSVLHSLHFTVVLFCSSDGFLEYRVDRCEFNSTDLKHMEYIYSRYYKKIEYIRFSSSVGQYVGFTEHGVNLAAIWNNDAARLNSMRQMITAYCHNNIDVHDRAVLAKSGECVTPLSGQHPAMLVCSVYDFFPSEIKVSWLRDGQEVTSDVTSTEVMANGDWYYQTHSYLEYTPRSGEKISCVVEHTSLNEPLITDWDPPSDKSTPESTILIAIGASILTLGLILLLAGFFLYRWKARG
uniref:Ig-like domain-containing protein n=1 Tax=Oreochromis aureus TaxID=47969 RepID=A0A668SYJ2_OREAU